MKNDLAPGMSCVCTGRKPWKCEFFGIVQKVLKNSLVVIILATDAADDHLIEIFNGRTVISKKNVRKDDIGED